MQDKKKLRLDVHHLQGFIAGAVAGVLLTSLILGITFSGIPSSFLSGTMYARMEVYHAFPNAVVAGSNINYSDEYQISELLLVPYNLVEEGYGKCDGTSLKTNVNQLLSAIIENTSATDGKTEFQLPDLSGKSPLDGLAYYICTNGSYASLDFKQPKMDANGIRYFAYGEVYESFLTGEIKLAKNVDEVAMADLLMPCDGREISASRYRKLAVLIGTKYGGDGMNTVRLPDMTNVASPIQGARYYIVIDGVFPRVDFEDSSHAFLKAKPAAQTASPPPPTPTPLPAAKMLTYRAIPSVISAVELLIADDEYILGELLLMPFNLPLDGYEKCDGASYSPDGILGLSLLIGNTYGGDMKTKINMPSLANKSPSNGIFYYICSNGMFPGIKNEKPKAGNDGVKYYEREGLNEEALYGEIKLAKNVVEESTGNTLLLCDGRELAINLYPALHSLLSNRFGGDGVKTFKLPDMTKAVVPVDGAKYYISIGGLYPSFK
jgi:microcystin-dependent protein